MLCGPTARSDALQVAALLVAPTVKVTVFEQLRAFAPSAKLTVPPEGTASPLTPVIVATKLTAVPYDDGVELPN
jgi:hypothetical protein